VLALRGACFIEEALLREQHERTLRVLATPGQRCVQFIASS